MIWGRPQPSPTIEAGTRVYAIGDIHGRLDLLQDLHRQIEADAATARDARKLLVYLGDYVDRGPDSAGVVEALIEAPLDGYETVHLKGNHEDLMLRFLDDAAAGQNWMMNGGDATLESYGVDLSRYPGYFWGDGMDAIRAAIHERLPARHLAFLRGLALNRREGDYLFVHAGVRPDRPLGNQTEKDQLWIREPFLKSKADFGAFVVHGHTPVEEPSARRNRLGIDTGAVWSGRLTAVVLEGDERYFLQTG